MATSRIRKSTSAHFEPKQLKRRQTNREWLQEAMAGTRYDQGGDYQITGTTDVQCMSWLVGQGVSAAEVRSTFLVIFAGEDANTRRNIMGYCEL
jgi:hypothetical protein